MSIPRVSCLMPIYNAEPYLEEAVRSIMSQSFKDWELVAVNDGSTDQSAAILSRLAAEDARIVIVNQENTGIVGALNHGLQVCRGEFIARMDADDVSFPDRFEYQVDYLDTYPDCVLVGGVALDAPLDAPHASRLTGGRHRSSNLTRFPPSVAVSMHPLIMVRAAALRAVGGYRDLFRHAEDYDLFIRLHGFGTIDNPDKALLYYRRHEGAISLRHLDDQERNAALAEVEAVSRLNGKRIGSRVIDVYSRLRAWRRYISVDPARADALALSAVEDLVAVTGDVWSKEYLRVRVLIAANLVRWGRQKLGRTFRRRPGLGVA